MKSKNLHVGNGEQGTRRSSWLVAAGPALLVAGLVFTLSSLPATSLPAPLFPNVDKLEHGSIYALLGALLTRAACRLRPRWPRARWLIVGVLLAVAYGASDELHQLFVPGRSCDAYDLLADTLGALVGATLFLWLFARGVRTVPDSSGPP